MPLKFNQIPAHLALPMLLMRQNMKNSMLTVTKVKSESSLDDSQSRVFCPDCGRAYKLKSSLRNHLKWECGKEPQFNCPYCSYKAKQKMHITRHIERMHKVIDYSAVKQEGGSFAAIKQEALDSDKAEQSNTSARSKIQSENSNNIQILSVASIDKITEDQLNSLCLNLGSQKNNIEIVDMSDDVEMKSSGSLDEQLKSLRNMVERKFQILIDGMSALNSKMNRLTYNKETSEEFSASEKKLLNFIPLTSNKDLLKLEETIASNSDIERELMMFVKKTGGKSHKQLITRSLRRIFADALAKDCSWLGQRNNIKICDLRTISVIKDITTSNFVCDDKEFEGICAEWFRQGKQRYARLAPKE